MNKAAAEKEERVNNLAWRLIGVACTVGVAWVIYILSSAAPSPCWDGVPNRGSRGCFHKEHRLVVRDQVALCVCPEPEPAK